MQSLTAAAARTSTYRPATARCFSSCRPFFTPEQDGTPRPTAPWHKSRPRNSPTQPSNSADKLRKSLENSKSVRSWDSLLPPRPPTGANSFAEPNRTLPRSPLLANRRQDLLESSDPTSVYGLMGHDMGLDASRHTFSEEEFLTRHAKTAQAPEMRLRPSTGRIVKIQNKVDFARGLKVLDVMVRANKVSYDLNRQRFHERPGLKRKRLKSQRWKRRFSNAFIHTVNRVNELRRQGW